jgi:hypothetical protein
MILTQPAISMSMRMKRTTTRTTTTRTTTTRTTTTRTTTTRTTGRGEQANNQCDNVVVLFV